MCNFTYGNWKIVFNTLNIQSTQFHSRIILKGLIVKSVKFFSIDQEVHLNGVRMLAKVLLQ